MATAQALEGLGSAHALRGRRLVVGAAPLVRDDAVVGALVLVERAPGVEWWTGPARMALLPGHVQAFAHCSLGTSPLPALGQLL